MGRCKDCKYWNNKIIGTYTEQFGFCENGKFIEYKDIKTTYDPEIKEPIYDNLNDYHVIYGSDEFVDIETHKDFGCVNFEK